MISKRCAGLLTKDAPGILRASALTRMYHQRRAKGSILATAAGAFPVRIARALLEKRGLALRDSFFKTMGDSLSSRFDEHRARENRYVDFTVCLELDVLNDCAKEKNKNTFDTQTL